jgi:hypothetical protein
MWQDFSYQDNVQYDENDQNQKTSVSCLLDFQLEILGHQMPRK